MKERRRPLLVPQYMRKFKCTGPECEDSCCIGWRVSIDQKTYKKYKRSHQPELSVLFTKNITRNRSNPSKGNYAKIKLKSDGNCPFLTEQHLCSIQLKLGEKYLSNTCCTYPRITNEVNGIIEKSATMSCPEAARLALLNPEIMEFDEIDELVTTRNIVKGCLNTHALTAASKPQRYFWELRIFTISTLQNRAYTLEDRLVLLGMFYQKLQDYIEKKQIKDIPQLIAGYTNIIYDGSLKDSLINIPAQNTIQMELLKEMAEERFTSGISSKRYLECFTELLHGIEYTSKLNIEEIGRRYQEVYESYYSPFMAQHGYILENYLVNHVFKNLFPFDQRTVFDSYVMLIVHYALIKLHLIGMSGFHQNLTQDLVIKLIQSFAKTVEHNPVYVRKILDLLKQNGYNTLVWMALLIKN